MKKFNILWQSNKKKIPSQLQVKEKELFIEIENKIIKIPFTSIVNSTLKENTLSIETDENTYQLESEHAKLIKEKIKDYHKEKNKIPKKKSKEEILKDILDSYNKFIENTYSLMIKERDYLVNELSKFTDLKIYNSQGNFILCEIKSKSITAKEVREKLIPKRIIIRDCVSFDGLDEYFFRVCILKPEENKLLIDNLINIFK